MVHAGMGLPDQYRPSDASCLKRCFSISQNEPSCTACWSTCDFLWERLALCSPHPWPLFLWTHSSGGWKSAIRMAAWLVSTLFSGADFSLNPRMAEGPRELS